jgi:hypothetical protein
VVKQQEFHLWDTLVDYGLAPDVYYRPGYVGAYQSLGHGLPVALLVETKEMRALFPLLLRPLSDLQFAVDVDGFDAVTPYGYGGLLLMDGRKYPDVEHVRELFQVLRNWCREERVISVLLRLHPVLRQETWVNSVSDEETRLHSCGLTTAVDLSRWNDSTGCIDTFHKGRRSDLSFARRKLRVTSAVEFGTLVEDLRHFYELYEYRMNVIGAADFYHFPLAYYDSLAEGLGSRLEVIVAWLRDEPVGAALFMADRTLAHYHLSATNEIGRAFKATTLIVNAAADWARRRGCQYLHLGGGAAGKDGLFAFKASFGGEVFPYSFLTIVNDRKKYDEMLRRRIADPKLPSLRNHFFPEYRA